MARVFLDANVVIDIIEERTEWSLDDLNRYRLFVSPLSIHILVYLYKYRIPNSKLDRIEEYWSFIAVDKAVSLKALQGPTKDYEDNIQLHSAAEANCDLFLTRDKKLLKMKFFGKTKIIQEF